MKTKLFIIAALLVLASMFALISCNKDEVVDPADDAQIEQSDDEAVEEDVPVNEYDVEGAEMSTEESRTELEEKYKELQSLFNLAVDTVAKTEGEVKEAVKSLGTQIVDLINNKIANPDYSQFEEFIKDAADQIDDMKKQLVSLVPGIVG
ncbi:MAG: hypothetical protein E7588_03515 [Ruminococcaceae bacterium]|nr:hypothetical protein [Oscillospiraceae bacterium]